MQDRNIGDLEKDRFMNEVAHQLRVIFDALHDGHVPPEILKHRSEGFMQAGVFLGIANNSELKKLMESVHLEVTGMTIKERTTKQKQRWKDLKTDYDQYDSPAYKRRKKN
ncbi:MAG: hypothetical protein GY703_17560 [Gammaproteobacteria bacterium]|nr:hypothetical protein [Gammaproteobacteria bacterium]